MQEIHYTCQGESHKAINKVCQDHSLVSINDECAIAVVCDGHGGDRYFRSDIGSKIASEVTRDCVCTFVSGIEKSLFTGKPFSQHNALSTEIKNNDYHKESEVERVMRQLFASIIYNWRDKILDHANTNPLTDLEMSQVPEKAKIEFANKEGLEKTYGCTLMCYAQTPDYWFAFHIGDGKLVAFDDNGWWSEPVPWDEKCFLNKTTSLCDSSAIEEFRYCFQGDGSFPLAIFLGSDGIDDSFGETPNMINFYVQILKLIAKSSESEALQSLQEALPELSKIGSKDDMSVACVYAEDRLGSSIPKLIEWQKSNIGNQIDKVNQRITMFIDKKVQFESKQIKDEKDKIDYDYTLKEIVRAYETKRNLTQKYNRFSQEFDQDNYVPYCDDLGEYEPWHNDIPIEQNETI